MWGCCWEEASQAGIVFSSPPCTREWLCSKFLGMECGQRPVCHFRMGFGERVCLHHHLSPLPPAHRGLWNSPKVASTLLFSGIIWKALKTTTAQTPPPEMLIKLVWGVAGAAGVLKGVLEAKGGRDLVLWRGVEPSEGNCHGEKATHSSRNTHIGMFLKRESNLYSMKSLGI